MHTKNIWKTLGIHCMLATILAGIFVAAFGITISTATVKAVPSTSSWVDQNTMSYNGETFVNTGVSGGTMTLTDITQQCSQGTQKSRIEVGDSTTDYQKAKTATVFLDPPCVPGPLSGFSVNITNAYPGASNNDKAYWQDGTHILYGGETYTKAKDDGTTMTLNYGSYICGPATFVVINYAQLTTNTGTANDPVYGAGTLTVPNTSPCGNPNSNDIILGNAYPGGSTGGGSTGGGSDGTGAGACQIQGLLGWLVCPVLDLLDGAINLLTTALDNSLYTPVDQYFGTGSPILKPYSTFRNMAIAMLVIAGLVMVISEAAGMEIFAAYTIRKTLPRLVMATIGIALAWPILQFAITVSNDLGLWMNNLILVSFANSGFKTEGFAAFAQGLIGVIYGVGATAAAIAVSGGIVGSLLLTLLVALLVGFLVLAIRQMVILIGIIVAPLAIAASVLPGTYKLWDFWEDSMLGALAMFPIIMAFLAAGQALASVAQAEATANGVGAGAAITWILLAIFSLVGSLVLIPFAFRIAGGLVKTAHALVSGTASKGFFAKQQKFREERWAQRKGAAKSGNFWREGTFGDNKFGRFMDKRARKWSTRIQGGYMRTQEPFNKGRRTQLADNLNRAHAMEMFEKDIDLAPLKGNEDYWYAGASTNGNGTEADVRRYLANKRDASGNLVYTGSDLEQMVGATMLAKRKLGQHHFDMVAPIAIAGTGTGFTKVDPVTGEVVGDVGAMDDMIAHLSHGDKSLAASTLVDARKAAGGVGRVDLSGAGMGVHLTQLYNAMDGRAVDVGKILDDAFDTSDAVTLGRARKNGLQAVLNRATERITDLNARRGTLAPEEQQALGEYVAKLENVRDSSLYLAPDRIRAVAKAANEVEEQRAVVQYQVQAAPPPTYNPVTHARNNPPAQDAQAYEDLRATRGYNPYDPRNQP